MEISQEYLDNLYLEIGDTSKLNVINPIDPLLPKSVTPELLISLARNPEYIGFTAKHFLNMNLFPYQMSTLNVLAKKRLPMLLATRGGAKTTMLALYAIFEAMFNQGTKIVVAGAGLRQSGLVFEAMENIWKNAPVLQDICGANNGPRRSVLGFNWDLGDSKIIGIPIGTGEKIRGLRANVIIVDEFASINPDIFEIVIRGFAAVQSHNTFEKVRNEYIKRAMMQTSVGLETSKLMESKGNKIILAGTASYQFNHFYKYYQDYVKIISSESNYGINPEDYAIIRLPYDKLPPGIMDEAILNQGRATMDSVIFKMEYGCVFAKDSEGFYPASAIFGATSPIKTPEGNISFTVESFGDKTSKYVMGIDPASERDNLAITILKVHPTHREMVFCWSTNRKRFEEDKKRGNKYSDIPDYNTFIIRKIHDLFGRFNIVRMHLDSGGGGRSIIEGLKDNTKLRDGEYCIYDMDDEESNRKSGLHAIKVIEFSSREWYETSHFNLLKDITTMKILFPEYDSLGIEQERILGIENGGEYSSENILGEVEECKYQTTLVQETTTAKGQKRWDLPKVKGVITEGIKLRLRKDHFTSLLLANDAARNIDNNPNLDKIKTFGGYSSKYIVTNNSPASETMYQGPGMKKMRGGGMGSRISIDQSEHGNIAY
jgi:hypothetical protein